MRKLFSVKLTNSEVDHIKKLIRQKSTTESMARRCRILLDMDENHVSKWMTYAQCAQKHGGVCHCGKCCQKVCHRRRGICIEIPPQPKFR